MENNWEKVKLADVADVNCNTFRTSDFDEILYLDTSSVTKGVFGDYIRLSKNDVIPSRAKRAVKNNTIVYSTVRPNLQHFGILKHPKENTVVSTGFATVDARDNINPAFLYYSLTQDKYTDYLHTVAVNNVSAYPSINPSDLEKLELEIPDIDTQRRIATVLSCLDEKITLNNRINDKTLKQQILPVPDITTQRCIAAVLSSLDAKIALNNWINDNLPMPVRSSREVKDSHGGM